MNKPASLAMRIVLPLFLSLFVISSAYAFRSAFNYVSTKEDVAVIFFGSDQWTLIPFMSTSWSSVIDENSLSAELKERFHPENEVGLNQSDITAAFVFDSKNRKYIQVAGMGTDQDSLRAIDYDDTSRYPAMWVYFETGSDGKHAKDLWLKMSPERMPKITDFTMKRGWNFVWLTPDINMVPLDNYKGTCSIDKLAVWDGKWNVSNYTAEVAQFRNETPGSVFLLKVMNDCQLRFEPVVPQAPSLPD